MSSTFLASYASSGFTTGFGLTPIQYAFGAGTSATQTEMPPPASAAGPSTTGPMSSSTAIVPQPLPTPTTAPTHLQATLNEIQAIANDVEMQPPPSESGVYLVVDTNILLGYYEALRTFVDEVEKTEVPVVVVVPGIVVQELDRQKNREKLAWPARRASGWLLEKMQSQKVAKVQATEETCKPTKNWRSRVENEKLHIPDDMMNDHLILDCAQYFQKSRVGKTKLCSADNNVCIIARSQGIECITPPPKGLWTSLDIARSVYDRDSPLVAGFTASTAALGRESNQQPRRTAGPGPRGGIAPTTGIEDSDQMLIDDEDADSLSTQETPLNVLHDDVREYFTRLLLQLAARQGASELRVEEGASRHAPAYVRKDYRTWNAAECLQFLYDKSPGLQRRMVSPSPEVFLSKRYTARGARTGQEWSPTDWKIALENVARVGAAFGEKSLGESVKDLQNYLSVVLVTIRR